LGNIGNDIAFIFWGFWLLPLGVLVFRSGFFPRLLGILLVLSCAGYVISSFAGLLGYSLEVGLYTAWGELIFILWLLVKGVNADKWRQRALENG
jgi:hypothetical protein